MKLLITRITAITSLLLLAAGAVHADPITINPTTDGSSVDVDESCGFVCWVDTDLSDDLDAASTSIDTGESWTFDFFNISVGGLGGGSFTIAATLAFLEPEALSSSSGNGQFFTFFGLISGGSLVWDQPSDLVLTDGSILSVNFSNLHEFGFGDSATVSATVGRFDSVSVPEPGTIGLLGLGLLGMGLARRRTAANT